MPGQRSLRVAQSIKRELASIILTELKDDRIAGLVSIVEVECSADCRSAKVFISVFGDEEAQKSTMEALNEKVGQLRGEICRRLHLRFAPEMYFKLDKSLERGSETLALLDKIARGEV